MNPPDDDDVDLLEAPPRQAAGRRRRAFVEDEPEARLEEYEDLRPEWSRGRKILVTVIGIGVVIALFAGVAGFWAYRQLHPNGGTHREVLIDVPTGSSTGTIADLLEAKGVTGNSFVFKAYAQGFGSAPFRACAA